MVYTQGRSVFITFSTNNLLVGCQQVGRKEKQLSLTIMVSQGICNPTENCFLTTYHSSFMVHWWVLVQGLLPYSSTLEHMRFASFEVHLIASCMKKVDHDLRRMDRTHQTHIDVQILLAKNMQKKESLACFTYKRKF